MIYDHETGIGYKSKTLIFGEVPFYSVDMKNFINPPPTTHRGAVHKDNYFSGDDSVISCGLLPTLVSQEINSWKSFCLLMGLNL